MWSDVWCWAVYSCLFPTWVVVISWILELIVIGQVYTRNDSRLWERQLITIRLTSVSALIIDNIAGLKCVCVFMPLSYAVWLVHQGLCLGDNWQSFGLTSSISIILFPFFNLALSLSLCVPAALLTAFHQWVKFPHSAIIILMLYWHECFSDIVASATKP